jgi:hypothetical protein
MDFDIIKKILNEVENSFDIYKVSEIVNNVLIKHYKAEFSEIKILASDNNFYRLCAVYKDKEEYVTDQLEIIKRFGFKKTPFKKSLIGDCVKKKDHFYWVKKDNEDFMQFAKKESKKKKLFLQSAIHYKFSIPSKLINNFVIVPLIPPYVFNNSNSHKYFTNSICLHIFNLENSTFDDFVVKNISKELNEVLHLISRHFFSAVYFKKAEDEIEINKKVIDISKNSNTIESVLEKIVTDFGEKVYSNLNTIWYYDKDDDHALFGLHYIKVIKENLFLNKERGDSIFDDNWLYDFLRNKENNLPIILDAKNSLFGEFVKHQDFEWLKIPDVNIIENYKWKYLTDKLKIKQLIAIPIRNSDGIIAVLGIHPSLSEIEFERLSIDYFRSFISQILLTISFLSEVNFHMNNDIVAKELRTTIQNQDIFYYEFVRIVKMILKAEACSLFKVENFNSEKKGIYLLATTDTSIEAKNKIGELIYNINNDSITGHVAINYKSKNVFDINSIKNYYSEIECFSISFQEAAESKLHYSLIAVPIGYVEIKPSLKNIVVPVGKEVKNKYPKYIVRCINKKPKRPFGLPDIFNEYDKIFLNNVGIVFERIDRVFELLNEKNSLIKERNDLIDLLTHEIFNPIFDINSKIYAIRKSDTTKNAFLNNKLSDIEYMSNFMVNWSDSIQIFNDLLQEKKIEPDREYENISKLIDNVLYNMKHKFEDKKVGYEIVKKINIENDIEVYIDKNHFFHILYNLITNSLKYTKNKQIPQIEIELSKKEKYMAIYIRDWGIGIDEAYKDEIFEIRFRSKEAIKNKIAGKGFGLWLCKTLLESNYFSIKVTHLKDPIEFEIRIPNYLIKNKKIN